MKLEKVVGDRFKERPADCAIDSHALMLRGGYVKYVANGIYSAYTPLRRILSKIERIIREEMEWVDGQEVLFPVVLPASLWVESGRFESIGSELLRLKDRNGQDLVLGMTHEEAAVHLVREYGQSYAKYPFMIYQIQTKFRDEARPRGGLIRVREFTMKDAYSFHTSQEDLEEYYQRCFQAYQRIFARVGIPQVLPVASDSGMMGGRVSHEFMLLSPIGEDSIAVCPQCGYRANLEAAECVYTESEFPKMNLNEKTETNTNTDLEQSLCLVHTPGFHTIEEVCSFVQVPKEKSCKAVVYQKSLNDEYVVVFIRGDLDVNETKLSNFLGEELYPAVITPDCGLEAGFIGPYGLKGNFVILFDRSLENNKYLLCGANQAEYHYTGLHLSRDCGEVQCHDFAKIKEGGICPQCGLRTIQIARGIEVGNIFQLGTKYSKAMGMQYLDKDGSSKHPLMGCYGIGVGRLAAAVCEASHDEYGPIWPMSIAPWQVHLCCMRSDTPQVKAYADQLYQELQEKGVEVLYDDRLVSAGVQFSDADLLGIPLRLIVSPRNMKEGCCELVKRDKMLNEKLLLEEVVQRVLQLKEDSSV